MEISRFIFTAFLLTFLISCDNSDENTPEEPTPTTEMYFPPIDSNDWETTTSAQLNWNEDEIDALITYLAENNTEAFIILKDGKIVIEEYFSGTNQNTLHPWNSAGKTLISFLIGQAQKDGLLTIQDATSTYLGENWTSMTPAQENAITIWNQLTMTAGGDYSVENTMCYDPECLTYLNEPGEFWYYHNAFYTLLKPVLEEATTNNFDGYFEEHLKDKIGMNGNWVSIAYNDIYFSNARSMARFGLLNLNKGRWENEALINEAYFEEMTNTSQNLNPAYGYLWWLNGKSSYKLPQSTATFQGKLIPNAPDDLIAGLGANDKKLYVVPSEGLVIVRLGPEAENSTLGPSGFDNILWEKISAIYN